MRIKNFFLSVGRKITHSMKSLSANHVKSGPHVYKKPTPVLRGNDQTIKPPKFPLSSYGYYGYYPQQIRPQPMVNVNFGYTVPLTYNNGIRPYRVPSHKVVNSPWGQCGLTAPVSYVGSTVLSQQLTDNHSVYSPHSSLVSNFMRGTDSSVENSPSICSVSSEYSDVKPSQYSTAKSPQRTEEPMCLLEEVRYNASRIDDELVKFLETRTRLIEAIVDRVASESSSRGHGPSISDEGLLKLLEMVENNQGLLKKYTSSKSEKYPQIDPQSVIHV